MIFQTQQVTVGRIGVDPGEHWSAALKSLVVRADADAAEVLLLIAGASLLDRRLKHVVDRADRERVIKQVAEEFHHAPQRTVADQRQGEDQLPQPSLRDRQVEEHPLVVGSLGREGGVIAMAACSGAARPGALAEWTTPASGCGQPSGTLQWHTMPVSSVKLGLLACKSHQFGGNRRFLQTQFSSTQSKILLPKFEPGPKLGLAREDFSLAHLPAPSRRSVCPPSRAMLAFGAEGLLRRPSA